MDTRTRERATTTPPVVEREPATVDHDRRPTRRFGRGRDRSGAYSDKVEQAAERAAAATRSAAAAAAAERAHARPRTSFLALTALVISVLAAVAVATGALAGLGIVLGAVGVVVAFAGLAATGHKYRYLGGRGAATVALLVSLAAIVLGLMTVTGSLPGWETDTDQVARLRDQLPSWLT